MKTRKLVEFIKAKRLNNELTNSDIDERIQSFSGYGEYMDDLYRSLESLRKYLKDKDSQQSKVKNCIR